VNLTARRNRSFVNPTWSILIDADVDALFTVCWSQNRRWVVDSCVDARGQDHGQALAAQDVQDSITDTMTLDQVLAVLRDRIELEHFIHKAMLAW
jgi:hypothetical protein